MTGVQTEPRECPVCGSFLDGATHVGDEIPLQPKPGDLSFCFYCAAPLRFTETGFDLIPADEDAKLAAYHLAYRRARRAIRASVRARGTTPS